MMCGILENAGGKVRISSVIFGTRITNLLISVSGAQLVTGRYASRDVILRDGKLDMDLLAEQFSFFMESEHGDADGAFIADRARFLLLSFITGLVHGAGHCVVDPDTRDYRRMDAAEDLPEGEDGGDWEKEHGRFAEYIDSQGERKGWLISFTPADSSPGRTGVFEHKGFMISETVITFRTEQPHQPRSHCCCPGRPAPHQGSGQTSGGTPIASGVEAPAFTQAAFTPAQCLRQRKARP